MLYTERDDKHNKRARDMYMSEVKTVPTVEASGRVKDSIQRFPFVFVRR